MYNSIKYVLLKISGLNIYSLFHHFRLTEKGYRKYREELEKISFVPIHLDKVRREGFS
ncbi:MAG: hypothetical protein ACTSXJ_08705 [Candidatus Baldrarchaeia archaeon]